tara:strand:+ start:2361 stop:2576 length:216 start_codon:yes stop_codon:yes gene_type:complete
MIYTSHPQDPPSEELCLFLSEKIGLTDNAINLGKRHSEIENSPLPIVLWTFGLINVDQYAEILKWQNDNNY